MRILLRSNRMHCVRIHPPSLTLNALLRAAIARLTILKGLKNITLLNMPIAAQWMKTSNVTFVLITKGLWGIWRSTAVSSITDFLADCAVEVNFDPPLNGKPVRVCFFHRLCGFSVTPSLDLLFQLVPFDRAKRKILKALIQFPACAFDSSDNMADKVKSLSVSEELQTTFSGERKKKMKLLVPYDLSKKKTAIQYPAYYSLATSVSEGLETTFSGKKKKKLHLVQVFNLVCENIPELAGDRRRMVLRPPQVSFYRRSVVREDQLLPSMLVLLLAGILAGF